MNRTNSFRLWHPDPVPKLGPIGLARVRERDYHDSDERAAFPRRRSLKVFLLKLDDLRHTFYSEGPVKLADDVHPKGWLESTLGRLQGRFARSKGWFARSAKRIRKVLERFVGRDEPLLRGLRNTDSIVIHHPASWAQDQARSAWMAFLHTRKRHHALWLLLNAVVARALVLLAVLPGPNLVGYWFAYRVACHGLALLGIRKALGGHFSLWFHSEHALNDPLEHARPDQVANLAAHCGLKGLDVFLLDALPPRTVEPKPDFPDDPASSLHERDDSAQVRPDADSSASRPNGRPGAGREVGPCGS